MVETGGLTLLIRGIILGLEIALLIGLLVITIFRNNEDTKTRKVVNAFGDMVKSLLDLQSDAIKSGELLNARISRLEEMLQVESTEEKEEEVHEQRYNL